MSVLPYDPEALMIKSVGFIGFGNMGSALAQGLYAASSKTTIFVQEPDEEKARQAVQSFGATVNLSPEEFCDSADIILLAVKPQLLKFVLPPYQPYTAGKKVISIVAGVPVARLQEELSTRQVIRFMPNIAAQVGKALTAVSAAEEADPLFRTEALELAGMAGSTIELPEYSMAAFTGLCGSGIAYVFSFIHALALGGTKEGIAYDTSIQIALGTLEGATELVRRSGENPIALLSKVISPAGTTIQGVDALEEGRFGATVIDAVERAVRRARELE
jgi:pyrroline-5-carboxylate reductase